MITLFSTGCPKCKVLKKKLDEKHIDYNIENDVNKMLAMNITQVPMLKVDDKLYNFSESVTWSNNQVMAR